MDRETDEFLRLLKAKQRKLIISEHAQQRSLQRHIPISVFESDIDSGAPAAVNERQDRRKKERKFDVYYHQSGDLFHRYIIVLNDFVKLITLMRVSKSRQMLVSGK